MTTATITQTKQIINHQLDLLLSKPELAEKIAPIMLWGAPGVGKSSIIKEICKDRGIGFIDVRLSQREPVDMRGLPVPNDEKTQVRWLLSSEWPREPDSRGIILFDELTAADRTLQVAAYEFILDRRLGDLYKVPPGWLVCAAGNRSGDKAVAMTLSSALANRFCHIELAPDLEQWTHWASLEGLNPMVIAFLKFRPQCFFSMEGNLERGWPSPRSWERVAVITANQEGLDEQTFSVMVHGLVGSGVATEFLAFLKSTTTLPDLEGLLLGKIAYTQPDRADKRYALSVGLAHLVWKGPESQRAVRVENFIKIGLEMSSDFAVMTMVDAQRQIPATGDHDWGDLLFGHPLYEDWTRKHGALLRD